MFRAATIACLATLLFIRPGSSQDKQSTLLPKETVAAFSILNGEKWQNQWQKTALADFFKNKSVSDYLAELTGNAQSEAAWLKIILPNDDPVEVTGQFTYAVVGTPSGLEHLVQLDSNDPAAVANWISTISARLTKQGFVQTANNDSVEVFTSQSGSNSIAFSKKGNRGVACSNPAVLKQLLSGKFQPIVGSPEFQSTVEKSLRENKQSLFWWFVRPVELTLRDPTDKQALDDYNLIRSQGFNAVQAAGGAGTIDSSTNRIKSTGYVAIRQPLQRAARLLDFGERENPAIPTWCNAATSCGYINLKTDQFLERYSTLFDALYGEGETGVFAAVLDDLKRRTDGPQVDLQRDLVQLLDQRVFFATVQGQSTSFRIIGIPTASPTDVAAAVDKLFVGDSRASKQSEPNHETWKIMPLDDGYGIKEPFVISIRDNFLFIAPNSAVLDYLIQNAGNSADTFESSAALAKFAYRIDFERFAGRVYAQLINKQLSKSADSLLTRLNLKNSILAADSSKLPPFENVRESFDSVLNVDGRGDGSNWKLHIKSK